MAEEMAGFLPATVSHILIILTLLLAGVSMLMAAVGAAFAFRQSTDNIEDLEDEINRLREEVDTLKRRPSIVHTAPVAPPGPAIEIPLETEPIFEPDKEEEKTLDIESEPVPEPEIQEPLKKEPDDMSIDEILNSAPIWQNMLDDYHALLDAFDPEKGVGLVEPFVAAYGMEKIVCKEHITLENGKIMPKFVSTEEISEASCWAWPIEGQAGDYAIVPSPLIPYDKTLHEEGGMKETFATQYKDGEVYTKMRVEIPALFMFRKGSWSIEQPGLLKIEP